MDNWELSSIQVALDDALVTVAHECWFHLAGELDSSDSKLYAARKVESSLISLRLLQTGGMPTYNDWDALFYLTWYQPKQINVLYSLLQWMKKDWTVKKRPWWNGDIFDFSEGNTHVIDYGCGTFATMFAIAIAAARSHSLGKQVSKITVDNIDKSPAMTKLGKRIWDEFIGIMVLRHPNHPLCGILNKIEYEIHLQSRRFRKKLENTQCFVVAMHCVYEDSLRETRSDLSHICSHFEPCGVLITSHKSKLNLLERVCPDVMKKTLLEIPYQPEMPSQFGSSKLDRTTEWRQLLANKLAKNRYRLIESGFDSRGGINPDSLGLLQREVTWHTKSANKTLIRNDVGIQHNDDLPF